MHNRRHMRTHAHAHESHTCTHLGNQSLDVLDLVLLELIVAVAADAHVVEAVDVVELIDRVCVFCLGVLENICRVYSRCI